MRFLFEYIGFPLAMPARTVSAGIASGKLMYLDRNCNHFQRLQVNCESASISMKIVTFLCTFENTFSRRSSFMALSMKRMRLSPSSINLRTARSCRPGLSHVRSGQIRSVRSGQEKFSRLRTERIRSNIKDVLARLSSYRLGSGQVRSGRD